MIGARVNIRNKTKMFCTLIIQRLLFVKSDINLYSFLFKDIASKASSYRLLARTNEFAEDLTGQRMALNASQWKSETGVRTADVSNIYLLPY